MYMSAVRYVVWNMCHVLSNWDGAHAIYLQIYDMLLMSGISMPSGHKEEKWKKTKSVDIDDQDMWICSAISLAHLLQDY